jgi:4-amino-4-deoxy-L-arabinose transferase-like glycosyltransferase
MTLSAMTLFARQKHSWLVAILIAALVLPWCRVMCTAAPAVSMPEHCTAHATQLSAKNFQHNHSSHSSGMECPDNQQSITAGHYSALDSIAKQLPLWIAIGSALFLVVTLFDYIPYAFFRMRNTAAPPVRRHLLLCVFRD